MGDVQRQIDKVLKEVEEIHSIVPMGDPDPKQNLYQARSRREEAVRITVMQMSLALEDVIDGLFRRVLIGHNPSSKMRGNPNVGPARELDDLLESGRLGFEAKLKLARVLRIVTKKQHKKMDKLRSLETNAPILGCWT